MRPTSDPIERAHLKDAGGFSPPIHRFDPDPRLADLIRRYWVPVWSLPDGRSSTQRVLQYPVCQLVVAHDYAQLVGPRVGLSTKLLTGAGWAFGTMLQPAAGQLLLGEPMTRLVDRDLDLADLPTLDGARLVAEVRALLAGDPSEETAQRGAARVVEAALAPLLPVDDEGLLVNDLLTQLERGPAPTRVTELTERFALTERSLQRLCSRRVGLSPKWLIQRRRLHEAAGQLAGPDRPRLADLAAALGYADQAHFTRDFRAVTGLSPREYAAEPRGREPRG